MNNLSFGRGDMGGRGNPLQLLPVGTGTAPGALPLVKQYARILFKWGYVVLGITAAFFIAGFLISFMTTRLYTATAVIEIAREANKVVKIDGVEQEASASDLEFYQTQYGLLRSRQLSERVVDELKLADDPAFFRLFRIKLSTKPEGLAAGGVLGPPGHAGRARIAAQVLLARIAIDPVRMSRLVRVSFVGPDPVFSARVANAWSTNFIQSNLARRYEAASYARTFLEQRLDQLRQRMADAERQLVAYASSNRIINLPASGEGQAGAERSIVTDDLVALNNALAQATADRVRAEATFDQSRGNAALLTETIASPAISALRQKRAEVAADYAKMLSQFEPGYPPAKALASQIDQLDKSIAREEGRVQSSVGIDYREALARENALRARVDQLKASLLNQRGRSIQYNIFQRDVDTNRTLYEGLLQRYKEIGIAGGVGTNNVSIVDSAEVPDGPSSPRLMFNLAVALALGLVAGMLVALILERSDEALSDPQDIEQVLGLSLLGTVPKVAGKAPLAALADRKSEMVEAYLSIETNLEFATDHGAPRTLAVTSTRPSEGKSTTALAIATVLARAHKRVILVEGDMRSPSIHHLFGFLNDFGLSNFLAGSDDAASLIRREETFGISIMSSGPLPPNAAELLTGPRLQMLFEELLKTHDHIVIDCPPVMGLADAPLIASNSEGVVFVVESHSIRASIVWVALARLRAANARLIGGIMTKFETRKAHLGYGYYYGYGYGRDKEEAAS